VAWDGGREASRAVRRAVPWLQKANEVVILTAPTPPPFELCRLTDYLADQAIKARLMRLSSSGEAGSLLIEAAHRLGAQLMVAGAFGHPRFQHFIFGGTTRTLLDQTSGPALFLSH
jgi:nucleotide-binding universal stress UspA family protein